MVVDQSDAILGWCPSSIHYSVDKGSHRTSGKPIRMEYLVDFLTTPTEAYLALTHVPMTGLLPVQPSNTNVRHSTLTKIAMTTVEICATVVLDINNRRDIAKANTIGFEILDDPLNMSLWTRSMTTNHRLLEAKRKIASQLADGMLGRALGNKLQYPKLQWASTPAKW